MSWSRFLAFLGTLALAASAQAGPTSFGDPVLGDQLDLFGLGSITDVDTSTSGNVNLFELSLDDPADLNALQPGSFTLATLDFDVVSFGSSPLSLSVNALGDALGAPLEVDSVENAVVQGVPEPRAWLAFVAGFLLCGVLFGYTAEAGRS